MSTYHNVARIDAGGDGRLQTAAELPEPVQELTQGEVMAGVINGSVNTAACLELFEQSGGPFGRALRFMRDARARIWAVIS